MSMEASLPESAGAHAAAPNRIVALGYLPSSVSGCRRMVDLLPELAQIRPPAA
jgi:hypothetical protein